MQKEAKASMIPSIALNGGASIPQLGFGTLNVPPDRDPTRENTEKTAQTVRQAIAVGYRHFDTAQQYGNERGVGEGIATSGVPREEFFVTTKLGNGNHRIDDVRRTFEESLDKLGLEQLDLFLMHWPLPMLYDGDYVSTWEAMVRLLADGRVRAVGVSNFQPEHLARIIDTTGVVPAVNQIERHPYFANTAACEASLARGIAVEAWYPLGQGKLLDDPVIGGIAACRGRSVAQVILRWHVQHGSIVFPKSVHRDRMEENIALFDFELSAEEVAAIDALDRGEAGHIGPHPDTFDWIP